MKTKQKNPPMRSNFLFSLDQVTLKDYCLWRVTVQFTHSLRQEKPRPDLQADRAGVPAQLRLPEHCSYCQCNPHASPAADWNGLAHLEFTIKATPHRAAVKDVWSNFASTHTACTVSVWLKSSFSTPEPQRWSCLFNYSQIYTPPSPLFLCTVCVVIFSREAEGQRWA